MEYQGEWLYVRIKLFAWTKLFDSPSHFIYNKAVAEGLAARGHNVTFIGADVEKKNTKNLHFIHLEAVYEHYYK